MVYRLLISKMLQWLILCSSYSQRWQQYSIRIGLVFDITEATALKNLLTFEWMPSFLAALFDLPSPPISTLVSGPRDWYDNSTPRSYNSYLGTLTMPVTSAKAPKNGWNDMYESYDYAEYDGYAEKPYNGYGKRYTTLDRMDDTALLERCHSVLKTFIKDYKGRERVNKQSFATNSKRKKDYFGMGISWSYYDDDMK